MVCWTDSLQWFHVVEVEEKGSEEHGACKRRLEYALQSLG